MKFKIGDRVLIISSKEVGTVSGFHELENGPDTVEVIPDRQEHFKEMFRAIERIKTQEYNVVDSFVKLYTTEDDLELIMAPNPEWKDIWDKN